MLFLPLFLVEKQLFPRKIPPDNPRLSMSMGMIITRVLAAYIDLCTQGKIYTAYSCLVSHLHLDLGLGEFSVNICDNKNLNLDAEFIWYFL